MMQIEVLSLFPEIFDGFIKSSLIKRAQERGLLKITLTNIRDFAEPPHYHVDDTPYGGGAGMLMKPEPLAAAIESVKLRLPHASIILLSPSGRRFTQEIAGELAGCSELVLVCGRYEGVDQRVIDLFIDQEITIGDYVLMGGEVPAMVLMEAVSRLCDDVLGNSASLTHESFSLQHGGKKLLEAPQYTRPPVFRELGVPEVLLSGNHRQIEAWRREQALARTRRIRPELLDFDKGAAP
jgi:tRNA (guanine37-N1)-methyltransferase